jgi:hypothetical protein
VESQQTRPASLQQTKPPARRIAADKAAIGMNCTEKARMYVVIIDQSINTIFAYFCEGFFGADTINEFWASLANLVGTSIVRYL